jgi:hypothetical protein
MTQNDWREQVPRIVPQKYSWLYEKGTYHKFKFLRRQYHAGSLNFLIGTLFAHGTVFAQHGKISERRVRRWPILRWMLRAHFLDAQLS